MLVIAWGLYGMVEIVMVTIGMCCLLRPRSVVMLVSDSQRDCDDPVQVEFRDGDVLVARIAGALLLLMALTGAVNAARLLH